MNESKKTLSFVGVALALAVVAWLVSPKPYTPKAFADQGQDFFPNFTDPNVATTLEVVDIDETTGLARPFKVTFRNGRWTIPSHHDYPADAKDRLAKTAAGVIDIKKDDFRTDNSAEFERLGVIDPTDAGISGSTGRGKRVTLKDANESVLADFIVGKDVEGRSGFKFVRVPGEKRVYAVRMNVDLSTNFEDWIDRDLLQINASDLAVVDVRDYSINERTGSVDQRENWTLAKVNEQWQFGRGSKGGKPDSTKMADLVKALDSLTIVGVRPKPAGLSAALRAAPGSGLTTADMMDLQNKGFYLTRDGQLLSNEGEMQVATRDGVVFTLRFGEVLYGSGLSVTAGAPETTGEKGPAENRYLFVSASFDPSTVSKPKEPANTDFRSKPDSTWNASDRANKALQDELDRWKSKVDSGRQRAEELNARFANWYYVISEQTFTRLDVKRTSLTSRS